MCRTSPIGWMHSQCFFLIHWVSCFCLALVSPLSRPCLAPVSPVSRPCLAVSRPCLAPVSRCHAVSRPCLAVSRLCLAPVSRCLAVSCGVSPCLAHVSLMSCGVLLSKLPFLFLVSGLRQQWLCLACLDFYREV